MKGNILQNFKELRAAKAVVRLFSEQGAGSGDDERRDWTRADSEYCEDYLYMVEALADIEGLADDPDILAVADEAIEQPAHNVGKSRWPSVAAAAGVVVALLAGLNAFNVFDQPAVQDVEVLRYTTRIGEQKTVELPDGTAVTLNTGTLLLVELAENQRRVIMERGEAYFEVAKDESRPFSIDLGARSVTVLGTEFNVFKSPEKFVVAVIEGAVVLHRKEVVASANSRMLTPDNQPVDLSDPGQVRLVAGNVAEFDLSASRLVGTVDPEVSRLQIWRTGKLYFEEEPLHRVVHQLNRYSGKKIMIEDASIMDLKIYAAVDLNYPDEALTDIEKALPIKVIRHFDRVIIVGK